MTSCAIHNNKRIKDAQDQHPSSAIGVDEQHKKGFKRFPRFWQFNLCRKIE